MKKYIVMAALLGALMVPAVKGQGTFQFGNVGLDINGNVVDAPIFNTDGITPLSDVGGRYQASVYWALGSGQPLGSLSVIAPYTQSGVGVSAPGYIIPANQVPITGANVGDVVTLMLVAWDTTTGATWNLATTKGQSLLVNYALVAATSGATTPQFSSFALVVPEPSTMALAGLGAAALLIFRRRK
jgi:hypothetical protein